MNRAEKLKSGQSTFRKFSSPMSIGVLKQEKYNRNKSAHRQAKKDGVVKIAKNKQMFVPYVEWFIRKVCT